LRQAYDYWQDQPGCFRRRGRGAEGRVKGPWGPFVVPSRRARGCARAAPPGPGGSVFTGPPGSAGALAGTDRGVSRGQSVPRSRSKQLWSMLGLEKECRNTASHWVDWHPARRRPRPSLSLPLARGGNRGTRAARGRARTVLASERIQAMRRGGIRSGRRGIASSPLASPLPRALSRRQTGREILPFAGLGWFNPGAARSSIPCEGLAASLPRVPRSARSRCAVIAWLSMGGQVGTNPFSTAAPIGLRNLAVAALLPMG